MPCRHKHFIAVGVYKRMVIGVVFIDLQQADNAVEGRADIVAHTG